MPASNDIDMPVQPGEILAGKYRVDKVIGVGGMGIVVAATHTELEQRVALKFLLPQAMESAEAVERFLREARAAVRLKSENVAKVLDVGKLPTGSPYMVMEFLDGTDLGHIVKQGEQVRVADAVAYVLQACEAIAEAHSIGIIHRDLKPQNLFITRKVDGRPLIKVLDFGISKSIDTQSGLVLTRTSSIMGSPLYMSPEQMRSSKNVDARSDIWGLGVILYELLTGRVPFEAEAIPELCLKVVQDPAEPPKLLRPDLSDGLNAVVLRCLEKDPKQRFQNVAELANALEPHALDPASRGSAERIALTLQVPSMPPGHATLDPSVSRPPIATGGTAWGKTQNLAGGGKRAGMIAGIVAASLLIVFGVVFIALRAKDKPVDTQHAAASTTVPTATQHTDTQAQVTTTAPPATTTVATAATTHVPLATTTAKTPPTIGSAKKDAGSAAPGTSKVVAPSTTFE